MIRTRSSDAIRRQQLKTQGQIDVAALARTLPNTLKIRDDIQIDSGRLTWNVQSQVNNVGTRWTGELHTADVRILRDGQAVDWQFPLDVNFAAVDGKEIVLETLAARSDFFSLVGNGTIHGGRLQARADLERLVFQLSEIIDTSNMYVRGQMDSFVQWSETQPNQLSLDARARLAQFEMRQHEQLVCKEDELTTMLVGKATLNGTQLRSLDSMRLDVVSAGDFLTAVLNQPVAAPDANSTLPLSCRLQGEIGSWLSRLKPLGVDTGVDATGQIDSTTTMTANQTGLAIQSLTADIRNLNASMDGVRMVEPVVQLKTAGTVDLNTLACRFPQATLASQSFSIGAANLAVDMDPQFVVAGDLAYQANVTRLMGYLETDPAQPSTQQISGIAAGQARVQLVEDISSFQLTGQINDFRVDDLTTESVVWKEPKVDVNATGQYNMTEDQLQLSNATIVGAAVNLAASGTAAQVSANPIVEISGEYGYNLEGLTAILGEMLGPDIKLTGNHRQQFVARGPVYPVENQPTHLVANELMARAGAAFEAANVYGIPIGGTQVDASLRNGILQMNPIALAVGEGRAKLSPTVYVNTEGMIMTLAPEIVADRIRITPEMTGGWDEVHRADAR